MAARLESTRSPRPHVELEGDGVDGRYAVQSLIARGGVASVYRVIDTSNGKTIALKLLDRHGSEQRRARMAVLFEREFHTLVQLAHPRVVQAFDYGFDGDTPYYTMELLDGGDLRELTPMPWQEAVRAAYDVCSALSLLHSRRLVHLDLTPRNIRRTADGAAKLIDFGLMAPMGPRALLAGTPPYVAPEMLANVSLDGRTDLYSLGATLYHALTGRSAYPATRLQQLPEYWRSTPRAPSRLVEGLPPALDHIVLSMMRLDSASRPKSAAEVMERLLPLLDTPPSELRSVSHAYLSTPLLVGRNPVIARLRRRFVRELRRRGGGFILSGRGGVGRSRMLDAFVLEAKLGGAITLRAGASDAAAGYLGAAAALAEQLCAAAPVEARALAMATPECRVLFPEGAEGQASERPATHARLVELAQPGVDRDDVQLALRSWFLQLASKRALAIAIDDLEQIDQGSAALLATLANEAKSYRLSYAVTVDTEAQPGTSDTLSLLREHAEEIELGPLDAAETEQLLESVFGRVPNLPLLSSQLYSRCGGRPRDCMALAESLVSSGTIRYADGAWALPEALDGDQLPASMEDALARLAAGLSPAARRIGVMLALCVLRRLSRAQLVELAELGAAQVDAALDELRAAQLLAGDPTGYKVGHDGLPALLLAEQSGVERLAHHAELADILEATAGDPVALAFHRLHGGRATEGAASLIAIAPNAETWEAVLDHALLQLRVDDVAQTLELALQEAERSSFHARDLLTLRERLAHMSTLGEDPAYYYRMAPTCLERYKRDSGFYDWQALDAEQDAATRAQQALGRAFARYNETPEDERVLSPPDALRALIRLVVIAVPVGSRAGDLELLASLPGLLEPFAPLTPLVGAIARNARASQLYGCEGRWQESRAIWSEVLDSLETDEAAHMAYRGKVHTAICAALGTIEAGLGIPSTWLARMERVGIDPQQLARTYYIQKIVALYEGDWARAEHFRQQGELARLRSHRRQPLTSLHAELDAHALTRDLTGVKQVRASIHAMAERYPSWSTYRHLADAHYDRLRGELEAAIQAAERAIAASRKLPAPGNAGPSAELVKLVVLVEMGRPKDALAYGSPLLARLRAGGVHHIARHVERALSLAEADLGRGEAAMARVQAVIAEQRELGISGLHLGLSYETCAWIAIKTGNEDTLAAYSRLTAAHYRPGQSSVLGVLYERLQEGARRADMTSMAPIEAFESPSPPSELASRVTTAMSECRSTADRAQQALGLLCEAAAREGGALYLLSNAGLALAASNSEPAASDDAADFVRNYLALELDEAEVGQVTVTAIGSMIATAHDQSVWGAPDGNRYRALLLSMSEQGQLRIAGVALLAGIEDSASQLRTLIDTIAERLIADGDAGGAISV